MGAMARVHRTGQPTKGGGSCWEEVKRPLREAGFVHWACQIRAILCFEFEPGIPGVDLATQGQTHPYRVSSPI